MPLELRWSLAQNRRGLHLAERSELAVVVTVKNGDGMREQVRDYVQGLDGAGWTAGQIDDDGCATDACRAARQKRPWIFGSPCGAHALGEARNRALHDRVPGSERQAMAPSDPAIYPMRRNR